MSPLRSPRRLLPALVPAVIALGACSEPRLESSAFVSFVRFTESFEPLPLGSRVLEWEETLPIRERSLSTDAADGGGLWLERTLPIDAWTAPAEGREWRAPLPVTGAFAFAGIEDLRLSGGARQLSYVPSHAKGNVPSPRENGTFGVTGGELWLVLDPEEVPGSLTFGARLTHGSSEDGSWSVPVERGRVDAIPVWTGSGEEHTSSIRPDSALRFTTAFRAAGATDQPVTFRILLDDLELFTHTALAGDEDGHTVTLPAAPGFGLFRFEAEGPPGLALFLDPVLGPARIGSPGERPWGTAEPNLLVLVLESELAETGAGPFSLSALRAESARFTEASAPTAEGGLRFGGLLGAEPPADGSSAAPELRGPDHAPPTLAQALSAQGYRTAGWTQAEVLEAEPASWRGFTRVSTGRADPLGEAERLVAQDDGRPLFLLLQLTPEDVSSGEPLAAWLVELGRRGFFAPGYLVVTERPRAAEASGAERVPVALTIHGPGIAAGDVATPFAWRDVPRTLAELAAILPDRGWGGKAIELPRETP